ncbi:MAG: LPS biosynthesis glycosyltransferase [Xenococcaceae cyanobacterium MO_188.B19]|nr:LPS biosynthesis glycosyltransferase [Xenococcaceae cyanobacterium MO_188.B19]
MTFVNSIPQTNSPQLQEAISKILIIAYKESTDLLQDYFINSGFECEVVRQQHQPEYKNYSQSYLVLLNHFNAWQIAVKEKKPTLIVEADFVPVINFNQLPLPFSLARKNVGISWIYNCAGQIYTVSADGYAQGFSTSMVGYIITPEGAKYLIDFANEIRKNPEPKAYSTWDSEIDNFLRKHKLTNYIPFRNYGEHGGFPNKEHQQNGLSKSHRADVLYDKLAFLPMYADNSYIKFIFIRFKARLKGIGRLLLGKFLRFKIVRESSVSRRLITFALTRQLTLIL